MVANVKAHGVREPIWMFEGKILDGRNRYRAATEAGVSFETREFVGTPLEAIEHVWSLTEKRRHMNSSQRAVAAARREEMTDAYAPVREAAKQRADEGRKQGGTIAGRGRPKGDSSAEQIPESNQPPADLPTETKKPKPKANETRQVRAKAAGTNAKYIDFADSLSRSARTSLPTSRPAARR